MYPEQVEDDAAPVYDLTIIQSMLNSASLAGSRLETLVLQWPGELEVGDWVRLMPNLHRLCLYPCFEAYHQKLTVTAALAELPHLETFCFNAELLEMEAGCLPPSLRTLCFMLTEQDRLPSAIADATQLRSLSIRQYCGHLLCNIERLSQLTYLRLGAVCWPRHMSGILHLSAFPELQCLVLTGDNFTYPLSLKGASSPLPQLTYLNLHGVVPQHQRRFCAGLSTLTALKVLDTLWAHPNALTPTALAGMRQLRAVSLHINTAIAAARELQALPQLRRLCLHRTTSLGEESSPIPRPRSKDIAALLDQLPAWPVLHSLHLSEEVTKLLGKRKRRQVFQSSLAKLAAAGIEVQREVDCDHEWLDSWRAAAGAPLLLPDKELSKLCKS